MRCWLNGEILNERDARISPFDRGFVFGDGVYETIPYFNSVGVGMALHVNRFARSLAEIGLTSFDAGEIESIGRALLDDAGIRDGLFYVQVTRGAQVPRRHVPQLDISPTVFGYIVPGEGLAQLNQVHGIRASVRPDERWHRCSIKSVSLLGNLLALFDADDAGSGEAILHRDGRVTEGTMTSVFMVKNGVIATPRDDGWILPGVTRRLLIETAQSAGIAIDEREIQVEELRDSDEVFVASSRRLIDGVTHLDNTPVADGRAGEWTTRLFELLRDRVAADSGVSLHSLS